MSGGGGTRGPPVHDLSNAAGADGAREYVTQARAQGKREDANALADALADIRAEIMRVTEQAVA